MTPAKPHPILKRTTTVDFVRGCPLCAAIVEAEVFNALREPDTKRITVSAGADHCHAESDMLPGFGPERPQDEARRPPTASHTPETAAGQPADQQAPKPHPTTLFPMPSIFVVGGVDDQRM